MFEVFVILRQQLIDMKTQNKINATLNSEFVVS